MSSLVGNVPPWLEPAPLGGYPTRALESARLRYGLHVPASWPDTEEHELPTHLEHVVRGPSPAEGLLAQFMDAADPAADLRGWAEAPLALTGAPAVAAALAGAESPETLEWRPVEAAGSLRDRFRVDEIHLYEGLVRAGGALSRIYAVLARSDRAAWSISLALESSVEPGATRELVERSDDRRAGATLGMLRFS